LQLRVLKNKISDWAEPRGDEGGNNQIFFSTSLHGTQENSYTQRQGELTSSSAIQLELHVPLYKLAEIRCAIFNSHIDKMKNQSDPIFCNPRIKATFSIHNPKFNSFSFIIIIMISINCVIFTRT
jgi:hypothetical protein